MLMNQNEDAGLLDLTFPKLRNRTTEYLPTSPAKTLYSSLIADLLNEANLREGTQGVPRSTYCFRHTYATLRLQEGVDVYFLAEQMGTSVHMIESHYGHVNTIKHADRVLQGMAGWELPQPDETRAKAICGTSRCIT
jgi:integrase